MKSPRFAIVAGLACIGALAQADGSGAQRQRLAAERATVEARFRAQEAACRERFVVTPCVGEAKAARRESLAGLRQQELVLDDADRKQRAQNRQREIADKRAQSTAQAASAAAAAASAAGAPRPARAPLAASGAAQAGPAASRPALDGGAQAAARRAEKAVQRQGQARERQRRIEQREREHQKKGQKSAPLPASASRQ